MSGVVRFVSTGLMWGLFWVYGFSVVIGQKTVFSYLHQYLVQNSIVEDLDRKLAETLDGLRSKLIASKEAGLETIKKL
jgi:hypothetical protein